MKNTFRTATAIALAAVCLGFTPAPAPAQSASVDQLRAAIIFNILHFIELPAPDASAPLRLCVAKSASAAREVAALDGKRIGARPIDAQIMDNPTAEGCDVAYLGSGPAHLHRPGLLLIGEAPNFVGNNGMIGLVRFGNQVRFEINTRVARQAGITVSSKLLRLAARVQT